MIQKRNWKKSIFLLPGLITMGLVMLVGCGKQNIEQTTTVEAVAEEKDSVQIGFSFDSFVIERWERDRDVFVATAKELGAEVLVQSAGGDLEEQIAQIEYFIDKGVDAIVVVAVDCNGLEKVIEKAKNAGIYIISYDRMILNADEDLLITFDNTQVGRLMGQQLVSEVKRYGRIVCINGSESDDNVSKVQAGFKEVIDASTLQIVSSDSCPNWEAEIAYDLMQDILNSGKNFDAVMCGNDDLATMVYKALSERGMADKVVLVGQDADLAACQRIVNGWQSMTVYKSVEALARESAHKTIELIQNGKVETTTSLHNGKKDVPAILLEPVAVTKDNMDEVIIDGAFHLREEVYSNR